MKTYSFEKLNAWQESRLLVKNVYNLTQSFSKEEKYGLVSKIKRAAISVSSNITEGSGRGSKKDQIKFYQYAYSSSLEVINLVYLSNDLQYIDKEITDDALSKLNRITYLISRLIKSLN